jgi:membrane protein
MGIGDQTRKAPGPDWRRDQNAGSGRPSWKTAGLTAALLATGFSRRPPGRADRRSARDAEVPWQAAAPPERERGRLAKSPSEIPPKGWKDILLRVYHNISEDRVMAIAAGGAFYTILAIFPGLAAFVSIYGLFADPNSISNVLNSLSGVLPSAVVDVVGEQMRTLAGQPRSQLGLTFLVSVTISLWSANSGVKALFDALNIVYHEKEKRSFIKLNLISLTFTLAAVVGGLLVLALVAVVPVVVDRLGSYFGLQQETAFLVKVLRWPVLLVLISFGIVVLYRYGPSREEAQWRWLSWGSAVASLLWLAASMLFSWYVTSFGSYNKTYGSLGAAIVFMTWIWISAMVILLGAELDAEMEHQTARDTTTGRPKPLGHRGAYVADTVGAAHP